ncbi:MAG: hypothetical protein IJJ00_02365 [Erysipelotrichaceae bacterium]|nr:hypothetical protein [Erysipelotrichaceae bacterium]
MNTGNKELFYQRCREYFGDRADELISLLNERSRSAFFLNEKKASKQEILDIVDFKYEEDPLADKSFSCGSEGIGRSKAYELGLIYPQDIESSLPASYAAYKDVRLAIDLCAAPGGKSINALNRMSDDALLICNDVSYKRASILGSNLERLGLSNVIVTSLDPKHFLKDLAGVFDLVILDVPCSGEGMIRKYPEILDDYSISNILSLSKIQSSLLDTAHELLNNEGQLLYSTCTYAFEEDEDQIRNFLERHEDMELIKLPYLDNSSKLEGTLKLSPLNGTEGQFMALLRKKGNKTHLNIRYRKTAKNDLVTAFIKDELDIDDYYLYSSAEHYYLSFIPLPDIKTNVLSQGIYLGSIKGKRFEPSHSLYRSNILKGKYRHVHELNDKEYEDYISGKELKAELEDAYYLLTYKGMSIGHGRCSKGIIKNKYPKGLRRVV